MKNLLLILLIGLINICKTSCQYAFSISGGANICFARFVGEDEHFSHTRYSNLQPGYNLKVEAEKPVKHFKANVGLRFSREGYRFNTTHYYYNTDIRAEMISYNLSLYSNLKREYPSKKWLFGVNGGLYTSFNLSSKWYWQDQVPISFRERYSPWDLGFMAGISLGKKPKKKTKHPIAFSFNYYHGLVGVAMLRGGRRQLGTFELNMVYTLKRLPPTPSSRDSRGNSKKKLPPQKPKLSNR